MNGIRIGARGCRAMENNIARKDCVTNGFSHKRITFSMETSFLALDFHTDKANGGPPTIAVYSLLSHCQNTFVLLYTPRV